MTFSLSIPAGSRVSGIGVFGWSTSQRWNTDQCRCCSLCWV